MRRNTHKDEHVGRSPTPVVVAVLVASLAGPGCATLFKGPRDEMALTSSPSGAEVWVDGFYLGRTPVVATVAVDRPVTVKAAMEDHETLEFRAQRAIGAGWVILDLLALVFPVILDGITRSWYHVDDVHIVMRPTRTREPRRRSGPRPDPAATPEPEDKPGPGTPPASR